MKRLLFLASLIMLSCLACKHKGPRFLLRLKYNKGVQTDMEYHMYAVTDNKNDAPLTNEVVRMGFKVDSVIHDSLFVMSAKVDYIRTRSAGLLGGIGGESYSSDKDEAEMSANEKMIHRMFKPMLDSPLRITVSSTGRLVNNFAFSNGRKPLAGPVDYPNCQIIFPADSVAIGEEWSDERIMPLTGAKRESHYYIESIRDSVINIKLYGNLKVGSRGTSKFTGEYAIDQKSKSLISGKIETEAKTLLNDKAKVVVEITSRDWGFQ